MQKWQKIGNDELQYNGWRKIFRKTFVMSNGKEMQAEVSDTTGHQATAVIALTTDGQVVIARQFRCGPEQIFDELPGGAVDDGEDSEAAAVRELKEETGYEPERIEALGKVYKHAWMGTSWHYYIAYNCTLSGEGAQNEEFEEVEVDLISISQLFENARNAKMTDTEAVFLAYEKLKKLEAGL